MVSFIASVIIYNYIMDQAWQQKLIIPLLSQHPRSQDQVLPGCTGRPPPGFSPQPPHTHAHIHT